ncbi:MAG: YicC family protein [Deltaproteobacteria bacterium]|nr:YicC family protein [Deltaproteobacteria bacterium]
MILSMTAFGQARGRILDRDVTIEIRSVNNRFRDIITRVPKLHASLEDQIKKIVANRVNRGRVEVRVQVDESSSKRQNLKLDMDLARVYHDLLLQLKEEIGLADEIQLAHFMDLGDIIVWQEEEIDLDAFMAGLVPVLNEALDHLIQMRSAEGEAIAADFKERLDVISLHLGEIDLRRESLLLETKARLEERVKALTNGLGLDEARLLQEVAYLAERSDITEEMVRLRSHLDQFRSYLSHGGVVGRRLEFLLQEMNREVNTITSKAGDVAVTSGAIEIKSELEKFREQVQNLE